VDSKYTELLRTLKQKLDTCYTEYTNELLGYDPSVLIESASEIVAMKEVHFEMGFWLELSLCESPWPNGVIETPITQHEAVYLLALDNPLKELGQKWWFHNLGSQSDFHAFYKSHREAKP